MDSFIWHKPFQSDPSSNHQASQGDSILQQQASKGDPSLQHQASQEDLFPHHHIIQLESTSQPKACQTHNVEASVHLVSESVKPVSQSVNQFAAKVQIVKQKATTSVQEVQPVAAIVKSPQTVQQVDQVAGHIQGVNASIQQNTAKKVITLTGSI